MTAPRSALHLVPETPAPKLYYGKYRGTVVNNLDPLQLGRIMPSVPAVAPQAQLNWAMPCTPFPATSPTTLTVPPIGSSIWIEFEAGDLSYPIWSGGFWTEGQTPLLQTPAS